MLQRMEMLKRAVTSLTFAGLLFTLVAGATNHTVGAPGGSWDLSTDLQNWASSNTFIVGDNLTFNYDPTQHSVVETTNQNYEACSTSNAISTDDSGDTVIALTAPGSRYFMCGTPGHCSSGMKMQIDTKSTAGSASPTSSPASESSVPYGVTFHFMLFFASFGFALFLPFFV